MVELDLHAVPPKDSGIGPFFAMARPVEGSSPEIY
jgi:hypothetical protein